LLTDQEGLLTMSQQRACESAVAGRCRAASYPALYGSATAKISHWGEVQHFQFFGGDV
jgi:hypothetical protein